ncbi:P-loop containing nucleoside triphosphate hydrolase protein [Hypoxylon sp. FL1150]|nr:P-loop containing nucleoside triphosphate hydrolase protein [Hypoxylon sp. FL1150]
MPPHDDPNKHIPNPGGDIATSRSRLLDTFFYSVIEGKRMIRRPDDAKKFLESIVNRTDKPNCIERLASSKSGQDALHTSLTFDASARFFNTSVSGLLQFLSDPALKRICDGELLNQILWVMVDPSLFWNTFVRHFKSKELESQAVDGFTWLLLQLVLLPPTQSSEFRQTAEVLLQDPKLYEGSSTAQSLFQKIRSLVLTPQTGADPNLVSDFGPGGRHDNDFPNYHDIAFLPTRAELQSTERPYYMQASAAFKLAVEDRAHAQLDNQFRLLREDMLADIREDLMKATGGNKRSSRKYMVIKNLELENVGQASAMGGPFTIVLRCEQDILESLGKNIEHRKRELKQKPGFLRHHSFGCLMKDGNILAFATLDRNEDQLSLVPPRLRLQVVGADPLRETLLTLRTSMVDFLITPTPIFSYEPILERLQRKTDIELEHDLLVHSDAPMESSIRPADIIDALEASLVVQSDLQQLIQTTKKVNLDPSQVTALVHGLRYQTCLIQGPPGTGKSLVGALLAKILLDQTQETLLVLSYTNHALDQFLEDLMDIGIDQSAIVRLGSKSTNRTHQLLLKNQVADSTIRTRTRSRWDLIRDHEGKSIFLADDIDESFESYRQARISHRDLLQHLEFSDSESHFYDALCVPEAEAGQIRVGKKGAPMRPDYLIARWALGWKAGVFAKEKFEASCNDVWSMPKRDRIAKMQQWEQEVRQKDTSTLAKQMDEFNKLQKTLQGLRKEKNEQILQGKRIIGCTTTAASMFSQEIQAATPGIIIVEEAGEILESHILAAMGPSTKQLIQIGDHKQLRPKVKNYKLTVEAGHGYDLNRSLFERLVLQGRPHCTLLNQHRMRPEISALIRHNYPALKDATDTVNRPHLLGFQSDVVFVNHHHSEAGNDVLVDKLDQGAGSSKKNTFEAEMVLKCVRYLGQQHYKTTDIVILTPYLGQLVLLRDKLSRDHDPVLNDIDSHDLVEAGIIPAASAQVNKNPIRLSTIDNYQGEESDIVVASLTRSNADGDIGFMAAPERLNVLVSRARNALIMIGSADTFMNARKGSDEWIRLFEHLKADGRIHDGFPLKCEKHPETKVWARSADEFDLYCPDGGCALSCNELLSCGKHQCPKRCHLRVDHSKVQCNEPMKDVCPANHKLVWRCSDKVPPVCQACRREKEEQARKARRDRDLELERQAKQLAYAKQLQAIQDNIASQRQIIKDHQEETLRQQTLQQHIDELSRLTEQAKKPLETAAKTKSAPNRAPTKQPVHDEAKPAESKIPGDQPKDDFTSRANNNGNGDGDKNASEPEPDDNPEPEPESEPEIVPEPIPVSATPSSAEADWQHQKEYENASNESLDSLFKMIGLESVKKEFLNIKARIDTALRQGADIKDERFGAALLGNPGTGKTTVARLYAKFLSSVGAIPGDHFEETTGSRLANDGIKGCKDLIDKILNKGGGVFFLDEAYQIVSNSSFGGAQVLDFLLAEIENLTGKVVFVFAGYRKQMEAFFAHNPGIPSRIPIQLDFQDYEDVDLLKIMNFQLKKKFAGRMKAEGGPGGLYMRVVARRIGRGRGREGFGNAREVQNVLSILLGRQADRLHQERRQGKSPDDLLLRKIDLIGPEPAAEISKNKDWIKLRSMIGLNSVKDSITVLVDRLQTNYQRELKEVPLVECSLNKVFMGNPGTGKTTVAKLYGKILKALGLLSNGEVIIKNPADFVGSALGQSEKNTKAILDSTKGKILIIDEAYMLASGTSDTGGVTDPYKTAVVDTIVAEVQSTALEDRCVLLLGYSDQMTSMFQKVNPGLTRRFPLSSAFIFEDYTDDELRAILDLKLGQQAFKASEPAKKVVLDVLGRARNRPNFGNAGEVDILLDQAKERQQKRLSKFPGVKNVDLLIPEDIDPDFNRGERAATNIRVLFKDVIGCENIVDQLEGYQQVVQNMKTMDMDPRSQIPFGFLFRGPPGTGKTTTARKMGKIYYDMGFLAEATVTECSATDIIGQYVGQTGPKVQDMFNKALGRVLFVDEAYRLAEGHFAKEAMDEIVDCMTKERFQNKLVVILAGYDNDINRLMSQNPGLTSRFPETIAFHNLPPRHCRDLLLQCLQRKKLDVSGLEASTTLDAKLLNLFGTLAQTPSWGNARDIQTLAKSVFSKIMKSKVPDPNRIVPEGIVLDAINTMIRERSERASAIDPNPFSLPFRPVQQQQAPQEPPRHQTTTTTTTTAEAAPAQEQEQTDPVTDKGGPDDPSSKRGTSIRDAGVSDAVWDQLQRDRAAAEQRERELIQARQEAAELERKVREQEEELKRQKDEAARREVLRKLEAARIERERAERARKELEERQRKEQEMKAKLMRMGRCPAGFEWIQQGGGYRCAGGSHFMGNGELGI